MSFKRFKTEKMLIASIVVLTLFIFASAFSKELGTNVSMAEEASVSSSNDNEESNSTEESQNDEDSQDNDASQDDEKSESSVLSTPSMRTTGTELDAEELSEKSLDETSQQSQQSVEAEEASEVSETSQEVSEESIKYVEGYGEVVSKEGNIALVKKDEKLFFLIPVEVESKVTLNEQGAVTDSQKSFLNWLLSIFSF